MATVKANVGLNINNINLNWYSENFFDSFFYNDAFNTHFGRVYEDDLIINGWDGVTDLGLGFSGSGFTFDANGNVTGGTVNALAEFPWNGGADLWGAYDFSVSAASIYNAALTASNSDELAVLKSALSGRDFIYLSEQSDNFRGFLGNDDLYGYGGNDRLYGDAGRDNLFGGSGNDVLSGGGGMDVLNGGLGRDTLNGGGGNDSFVFADASESSVGIRRDVINGFATGDIIDLSGIDARSDVDGNQGFTYIGNGPLVNGESGLLRYTGGIISGDVNGDGIADFEISLSNFAALTVDDFAL